MGTRLDKQLGEAIGLHTLYLKSARAEAVPALLRAIELYREVASAWHPGCGSPPHVLAAAQNNLGNAYRELPLGDRAENLYRAIDSCRNALLVYTEQAFPADWARAQNNLGNAYRALPAGDRTENLQRAIAFYEAALRVHTEQDAPYDWATGQANLGNTYQILPAGDSTENLRRAIAFYEAALRVHTEQDTPSNWAMTQNNLGVAHLHLPEGDRTENLQRAIAFFDAALRVHTEQDAPSGWAMIQHNLGVAYKNLPVADHAENLQRAIDYYEAALRVYTERDLPADWAMTQSGLGNAYRDLAAMNRRENLQRAIAYYEAALRVYTPDSDLEQCRQTLYNLSLALFDQEDWPAVVETAERLLTLAERQRALAVERDGRQRAAEDLWQPLVLGVTAAARLIRFETGLQLSARAKAQDLVLDMLLRDAQPRHVRADEWVSYRDILNRIRSLAQRYRTLRESPPEQYSSAELVALLDARRKLDTDRLAIEARFAALDPDYAPFAPPVPQARWGQIAAQSQAVLIDLRVCFEGTYFFLVGPGEQTVVPQQCVLVAELTDSKVREFVDQWIEGYYNDPDCWKRSLETATGTLYSLVLANLHARLAERYPRIRRLVLFPNFGLNLLPLHAAWYTAPPGFRRYFGDDYEITYAPSIQVLDRCLARQQAQPRAAESFLAVENPRLPLAWWEVKNVERHFAMERRQRIGPCDIRKEAVVKAMSRAEHLLFTTHGSFALRKAEESAIEMNEEQDLTVKEIVQLDLRQVRVTVLSACETGLSEVGDLADEYLGLPAAFLLAGVQTVIASQWKVDELATALLMEQLHENIYERRMGQTAALQAAQQWLRELTEKEVREFLKGQQKELALTADAPKVAWIKKALLNFCGNCDRPFDNPYYWAAFFAFGAPGAIPQT